MAVLASGAMTRNTTLKESFTLPAALAGREDTIRRLMLEGKTETAQERCTKWEAPTNLEEPLVREA